MRRYVDALVLIYIFDVGERNRILSHLSVKSHRVLIMDKMNGHDDDHHRDGFPWLVPEKWALRIYTYIYVGRK